VEQRLEDLGYWTGPVDGKLDETSQSALIAFQKVTGRSRNGKLTRIERSAVLRSDRPIPLETGPAHVEVDLRRQVLFIVDENGVVTKTLPVSTGSGEDFFAEGFERTAVTPPGRFTIQGKVEGWKKSALGRLYYPNYIIGGIAIHGYPSVPAKPASHGCIRIPMFAAKEFSHSIPVGTLVLVHQGIVPDESSGAATDRNH
jgi:lipoprotein-anchoring transpeptidase ErfK/SrfK